MPHCFVAGLLIIVTAPLLLFLEHLSKKPKADSHSCLPSLILLLPRAGLEHPLPPLLKFNYLSTNPHHPLLATATAKDFSKKKFFFKWASSFHSLQSPPVSAFGRAHWEASWLGSGSSGLQASIPSTEKGRRWEWNWERL